MSVAVDHVWVPQADRLFPAKVARVIIDNGDMYLLKGQLLEVAPALDLDGVEVLAASTATRRVLIDSGDLHASTGRANLGKLPL